MRVTTLSNRAFRHLQMRQKLGGKTETQQQGGENRTNQRHPALLLVYLYLRGPLGSACRHRCVGCMQQNECHILGQACAFLSQKFIAIKAK